MNVEMGTETPIFLFWRNFGILSLQCKKQYYNDSIYLSPGTTVWFKPLNEFVDKFSP
jgi:hypothetical protein